MPVVIRNKTNSIEIDVSVNLKYTVSKGGYDVVYEDVGNGVPFVYVLFRSSTLVNNTIPLDWRDCSSPDTTFTSAEDLRDKLIEWNIQKISVNDSALPDGAATDAKLETFRDGITNSLKILTDEHHKIHEGDHFFYTDSVQLNADATQDYLLTTPDTTRLVHLKINITGNAITQFDLFEASDKDGTTPQVAYNSNRNSEVAPTMTIHKGISGGSTDGIKIYTMKSGSATQISRDPLVSQRDNEIILKQNTKYIVRITSGTNSNLTNTQIEWYEHTNIS